MADQQPGQQGEARAVVELRTSPEMERVLTEQMRAAGALIGEAPPAARLGIFGLVVCCNSRGRAVAGD